MKWLKIGFDRTNNYGYFEVIYWVKGEEGYIKQIQEGFPKDQTRAQIF